MQHSKYSRAFLYLFLTVLTFLAYVLGGGPAAYSPQMNAVPVLMVLFTLYFFWKAALTDEEDKR